MKNLASILPLKSKLRGIFHHFNAIYGSIEILKMEILKHFTRSKHPVALRKLFRPPPDKISLRLWDKSFLIEIYMKNIDIAFKVLPECSSCASGNDVAQKFFQTPTRNMFAGKFVKWVKFLAVLWQYIFYNVEWVENCKMGDVFWVKLYYKMSDLFSQFFCKKIRN